MQNILQTCVNTYSNISFYIVMKGIITLGVVYVLNLFAFMKLTIKTFKVSPLFTQAYDRYHLGRCRDERGN